MNLNLLYTMGVGNSKSNKYILFMQLILYVITVNMTSPIQGLVTSIILAIIISTIFIAVLSYYNSDSAISDDESRYIKTIYDKNRVFRRLIVESYLISLAVLVFFYLLDIVVAKYALYTAPASFLLLLLFLIKHEKNINGRYEELRNCKWVFDYNTLPMVISTSDGKKIEIPLFDDNNKIIIAKSNDSVNADELFDLLPPGTKIYRNELLRPDYKVIKFASRFTYININTPMLVFINNETKNDEKIKNLYIDILSKYKDLYDIKVDEVDVLKTQIKFNDYKIETYIGKNDYVKKFVAAEDVGIIRISLKLKDELSTLPLWKAINRIGQKVKKYDFDKNDDGIFISEVLGNNHINSNISYFEKYMSMNEKEYHAKKDVDFEELLLEASEDNKYIVDDEEMDDYIVDEAIASKSLYRINIKGELVYVFIEDLATLSELDELIVSKFINSDIDEMIRIANQDRI